MTLVALKPVEDIASRTFVTVYAAVVTDDAQVVLDDSFNTASARRDAVVELLTANHDEVSAEEIDELLTPFGGANADVALGQVVALFVEAGADLEVHLGEHQKDIGPAVLYSSFTDYGNGQTFVDHYSSREERLAVLRQRAADLTEDQPVIFFDTADEETCRRLIEFALTPTHGRVYLVEAERHGEEEIYSGQTGED